MTDRNQEAVQKLLFRTVSASCGRHLYDAFSREECALEFVEYILLFLDQEKRNVLLADENEKLLRRVAFCFVLNWKKKAVLRQSRLLCFTDLPAYKLSKLASSATELLAEILNGFSADLLRSHLSKLPAKQRYCAVRRWLEDRSIEEIADELKLSPMAVRKNLQYARDKLRDALREMG